METTGDFSVLECDSEPSDLARYSGIRQRAMLPGATGDVKAEHSFKRGGAHLQQYLLER